MINSINGLNHNQVSPLKDTNLKISKETVVAMEGDDTSGVVLETGKSSDKKVTYDNPAIAKPNVEEVAKLWEQADLANESLKNLVKELLQRQGMSFQEVVDGNKDFQVDDKAISEAAQQISDTGEFGVQAVSDKIIAFAKAISGGDKSKIDQLRNAIKQGFDEAAKILGGTLPDISQKTYDEVMKKLDAWQNEGNTVTV